MTSRGTEYGSSGGVQPQKLAPNSQESEEAVLGSILINPEVLPELLAFLRAEDFYFLDHRYLWEAIVSLHERGDQIDTVTLVEEMRYRKDRDGQPYLDKIGGPAKITYLINSTPTHIHVETYARLVERLAVRRRLLDAASAIAKAALDDENELEEVIDRAEKSLFAVTEQRLRQDVVPMSIAVRDYFERMEELYEHRDEPMGLPTGFHDLDKLLGGMQRSDLIIVAARPGVGKTSFMLSIALNAARARNTDVRVALFSLEMSREQLLQRFFSAETGINSQKLRLGDLDESQWGHFVEATSRLDKLHMYIDDTPAITVQAMRTKCRRLQQEFGLDLIICDYLQLMGSGTKNENRVQEISFISRGLKEIARELNVPLLTAAQLSRAVEQRSDKRPQLSDLRESGCLAGDTLVYLPDTGEYVPIRSLEGTTGFRVSSLNQQKMKLETCEVTHAFFTGFKPVFRLITALGREIRATANHKFLTMSGWKRLDELQVGEHVALQTLDMSEGSLVRRERATRLAAVVQSEDIHRLATSDVYWDAIKTIQDDGSAEVFDLTVPAHSNFVAADFIVHNSIEQDADIVMFIYRDDMYNPASETPNQAEIIIGKHRNGPTGIINLYFQRELTQFKNMQKSNVNLANY